MRYEIEYGDVVVDGERGKEYEGILYGGCGREIDGI